MFRSMLELMLGTKCAARDIKSLRLAVADWIHQDDAVVHTNKDEYVLELKKYNSMGEDLCLKAISEMCGRAVVIFQCSGVTFVPCLSCMLQSDLS